MSQMLIKGGAQSPKDLGKFSGDIVPFIAL